MASRGTVKPTAGGHTRPEECRIPHDHTALVNTPRQRGDNYPIIQALVRAAIPVGGLCFLQNAPKTAHKNQTLMTQGVMDVVPHESFLVLPSSFGNCIFQILKRSVAGLALRSPTHILDPDESATKTAEAKERGGVSGGRLINCNPSNASDVKENEFKRFSAQGKLHVVDHCGITTFVPTTRKRGG